MTPSPADLASLTGMPAESSTLADLCAAMDVSTGLDPENPKIPAEPGTSGSPESLRIADIARRVELLEAFLRVALAGRPALLDSVLLDLAGGIIPREPAAMTRLGRDLAPVPQPRNGDEGDNVTRLFRSSPPALPPEGQPADGQICAVLAVDIAGFGRPERDDVIRRHLHEQLYKMVATALDASGVPWARCRHEDRGDAVFVVIPPEISIKNLIDPFPERLCRLIRDHNHVSSSAACMQLRAALHAGPVDCDANGVVSTDVNFMFRMLDARSLKQTLKTSGAELALAVSNYVYRSVVCRYPSRGYPEEFRAFRFQTKETKGQAWVYLPVNSHVTLSRSSQQTCVR